MHISQNFMSDHFSKLIFLDEVWWSSYIHISQNFIRDYAN